MSATGRNLVLCFDGTDDFAAKFPTHVFRLFRTLERSDDQRIYYAGGVGTLKNATFWSPVKKWFLQKLDLAAGFSIRDNFLAAYEYLIENYEEGDQIYLFGFSRGAYTARALAAAIHYFGLPHREHKNMLPYLWQAFTSVGDKNEGDNEQWINMNRLKGAFSPLKGEPRRPKIRFLGVWDTVSSFGFIRLRTLPNTSKLEAVETVRHAVSIGEQRNMFPENLCSPGHSDLKEVWFAGVHRDVGGGAAESKRELSMCPYRWVVIEAALKGLRIDKNRFSKADLLKADPCGPDNANLLMVAIYAVFSVVPMRWWSNGKRRFVWKWLNLWHVRQPGPEAQIHRSVELRMKCPDLKYSPRNLKSVKPSQYVDDAVPPAGMPDITL